MLRLAYRPPVLGRGRMPGKFFCPRRWQSTVVLDKAYPNLVWHFNPAVVPRTPIQTTPPLVALSLLPPSARFTNAAGAQHLDDSNQYLLDARTTIGWVTQVDQAQLTAQRQWPITPQQFINNPAFQAWLHQELKRCAHYADPTLCAIAKSLPDGWTHIADERHPPPYGRIPSPEDIIGSVKVEGGQIVPESYQPMPSHRPVSAHGLFRLSDGFHRHLVAKLGEMAEQQPNP
ncbi:hypothetical protein H4R34_001803 [Dimargaris verticillata]|uniref:Uncharacterized protein n=1 Tax=Dimargaris verticillata TaxID=2761393 RepID=A0A9W8B2Y2_9FUNG|nr:hypothetical protein H4R34_001803 [Dimargaris verticillata]